MLEESKDLAYFKKQRNDMETGRDFRKKWQHVYGDVISVLRLAHFFAGKGGIKQWQFLCNIKSIGPYFFGSERKLGDGFSNTRSSYFVQSELVPQQSTLLGMLRFFLLKQAGYVRDDYRTDEELIGRTVL